MQPFITISKNSLHLGAYSQTSQDFAVYLKEKLMSSGNLGGAIMNDWIIKGIKGEFYPCKPDIFEKSYTLEEGQ